MTPSCQSSSSAAAELPNFLTHTVLNVSHTRSKHIISNDEIRVLPATATMADASTKSTSRQRRSTIWSFNSFPYFVTLWLASVTLISLPIVIARFQRWMMIPLLSRFDLQNFPELVWSCDSWKAMVVEAVMEDWRRGCKKRSPGRNWREGRRFESLKLLWIRVFI